MNWSSQGTHIVIGTRHELIPLWIVPHEGVATDVQEAHPQIRTAAPRLNSCPNHPEFHGETHQRSTTMGPRSHSCYIPASFLPAVPM